MPSLRTIAATTHFASSLALSCMWYSETIVTEEIPFPTNLELISGNFPRHGQEYLRWSVKTFLPGSPSPGARSPRI